MLLRDWLDALRVRFRQFNRHRHVSRRGRRIPDLTARIESLESRVLLATINWDGGGGDFNWNTAANWAGDVLPGATDDAVIGDLTGTPTIVSTATVTVNSVTSAELLDITSGSFTVNAASDLSNGFSLEFATLTVNNGTLTVSGNSTWTGGTLAGNGEIDNLGSLTLNSTSGVTLNTTLVNESGATITHNNSGGISGGGLLDNIGDYNLAKSPATGPVINGSVTFNNFGTLYQTVFAFHTFNGTFNNLGGTIQIDNGSLTISAGGANTGGTFITGVGSTINLSNSATYTGTYTGEAGGSVALSNNLIVGAGGATFDFAPGVFTWTTPTVKGGTLTVNRQVTGVNSLTVFNDAGLIVNGTFSGQAGGSVKAGATLSVSAAGTLSGSSTVNVENQGHLAVDGMANDAVSIQAGGLLTGSGTITGDLLNRGYVNPGGEGTSGILTISGNYTQDTQSRLTAEVGGTVAGTGYDQLVVTGNVSLNRLVGVFNERLIDSFLPSISDTFQPLTYGGTLTQYFAVYSLQSGSGIYLNPVLAGGTLTLTAAATTTNTLVGTATNPSSPIDIWHDPLNWSRGVVPTISDDVIIPDLGGTTITFQASGNPDNTIIHSITSAMPVSIDSATSSLSFTVSAASAFNDGLTLLGSNNALISTDGVTLAGNSSWGNQTLRGDFTNTGTLALTAAADRGRSTPAVSPIPVSSTTTTPPRFSFITRRSSIRSEPSSMFCPVPASGFSMGRDTTSSRTTAC